MNKIHFISRWSMALVILFGVMLAGCGGSDNFPKGPKLTFTHDGLNGRIVTRLYEYNQSLFAATDNGLYVRSKGHGQWRSIGLSGTEVLDVVILGSTHALASTYKIVNDEPHYQLMESTNAGATWHVVTHNFGGEEGEGIFGLLYDGDNKALYATGIEVLAMSLDEGRSWEILSGEWQGFGQRKSIVKRNAASNDIWYGGQNALEQMVLRAYSLDTQEERNFPDLLPSPSVIYGIQFGTNDAQRVLVSGEGGVLQSKDNGAHWQTLIGDVDYRFYFDVAIDPHNPKILYTAGWDKNWDTPQPLIFEVSTDDGNTWNSYRYPSNSLFGGVRSMIALREANKTVVYLGLYRGGVMKVRLP